MSKIRIEYKVPTGLYCWTKKAKCKYLDSACGFCDLFMKKLEQRAGRDRKLVICVNSRVIK